MLLVYMMLPAHFFDYRQGEIDPVWRVFYWKCVFQHAARTITAESHMRKLCIVDRNTKYLLGMSCIVEQIDDELILTGLGSVL